MTEDKRVFAMDTMKTLLDVVESVRAASTTAFDAMILIKTPCNKEIMQLGMLLQASLSFSVALKQWIKLCEEQEAAIMEMDKNDGN